jgi:hypothetical protein
MAIKRGLFFFIIAAAFVGLRMSGGFNRTPAPSTPKVKKSAPKKHPLPEGWKIAFPHGFIVGPKVAIRKRPDSAATILYSLKGGERVSILQQTERWWRIRTPHHSPGWILSQQVQPHVDLVLLDLEKGRVVRRIATMGEFGHFTEGTYAYAAAKEGPSLSRTSLTANPSVYLSRIPVSFFQNDAILQASSKRLFAPVDRQQKQGPDLCVIDLKSGKTLNRFPACASVSYDSNYFSPDDQKIATMNYNQPAHLYDWSGKSLGLLGEQWKIPPRLAGNEVVEPHYAFDAQRKELYCLVPDGNRKKLVLYRYDLSNRRNKVAEFHAPRDYSGNIAADHGRAYVTLYLESRKSVTYIYDSNKGIATPHVFWPEYFDSKLVASTSSVIYADDKTQTDPSGPIHRLSRINIQNGTTERSWIVPGYLDAPYGYYAVNGDHVVTFDERGVISIHIPTGLINRRVRYDRWRPKEYLKYTPFKVARDDEDRVSQVLNERSPLEITSIQISPNGKQALITEYLNGDAGG